MSFIVRSYRPGDELKINEMFNEVFNQKRDISSWYWKYRDNPYGSYLISVAIDEGGVFAAHYGGYPVPVICLQEGETAEAIAFQMGDKMTKKQYRASGFRKNSILCRTAEHFYLTFVRNNVDFSYGFVTGNSRKIGLLLLKYETINPVSYWLLNLTPGIFPERLFHNTTFGEITVTEDSVVGIEWDTFLMKTLKDYDFLVKKNADFLKWRYLGHPDLKYRLFSLRRKGELIGWSVFLKKGDSLLWGDALFSKDAVNFLGEFFLDVLKAFGRDSVIKIEGWFSDNPEWWADALMRNGFVNLQEPSDLYFTIRNHSDSLLPERLRSHFYYTMGDSDLF